MQTAEISQFVEEGYLGPVPIITSQECDQYWKAAKRTAYSRRSVWRKALAVNSRAIYELAIHPAIIDVLSTVLGEDIMLWGASIQYRRSHAVHAWHSDIETALHPRSAVSVWIGIKNVTAESSPMLIPYSHRFGVSVQEERYRRGISRDELRNEDIEAWAIERDRRSRILLPAMSDGDALFFDGQLWHGSHNNSIKNRYAILLQYATPNTEVKLPELGSLDWPFNYVDQPRPLCIIVRGSSSGAVNRFISAPIASSDGAKVPLSNQSHTIGVPLACDERSGWKPYHLFNGSTGNHDTINCHVSSLKSGCIPHRPHRHDQEELLVMLDGEVDLVLPDRKASGEDSRVRLRAGEFVYYPANFAHTLQTVSNNPANYVMFKWFTKHVQRGTPLLYGQFDAVDNALSNENNKRFRVSLVFEGPTVCLAKLHAHTSNLAPGAGYAAHVDAHDVAIIVFAGEIEIHRRKYGQNSLIYIPAGELHDMHNSGDEVARYLVFEFHGHNGSLAAANRRASVETFRRAMKLFARVTSPMRWKRKLKRLFFRPD